MRITTAIFLMEAMAAVESGGDPHVYNPEEEAVGLMQIRQCVVDDLNRKHGTNYDLDDFYSTTLSRWAVFEYGKMYGAKTAEEFARIWNGGPNGMEKESTKRYWERVKAIMESRQGDKDEK